MIKGTELTYSRFVMAKKSIIYHHSHVGGVWCYVIVCLISVKEVRVIFNAYLNIKKRTALVIKYIGLL